MKAFKVIYRHGHFIDVETQKRLIPVQGAEYTISAANNAFKTDDDKLLKSKTLKSTDKALWVEKEYGKGNYTKILNDGERLFFRVGNSKKIEGDENHQYIFVCTLFEDLYLYLLKDKSGDEVGHWRLADCKCVLDKCLLGGLTLTERITAKSLNALFNNTVQFYFSMQRSGSTNAFNTFYLYEEGMEISFSGAINQLYDSISRKRAAFVLQRNNSGSQLKIQT